MKRDILHCLKEWKQSRQRKPLVLRGARQVGKTYLLKHFAQHCYDDYFYINFDEQPQLCQFFEEDRQPERILKELGVYFKRQIQPETSLIVFDEIQECPNALNSLKYFYETKSEYHVVTAGSLLGVKLTHGFPVGKVTFLDLMPMSFFEFLEASGHSKLRTLLEMTKKPKAISSPFHEQLITLLKHYLVVGGMPEAVDTYLQTDNFDSVRKIQKDILDAYTLDFAKHAPKSELMKIMAVWQLVPSQLAKENKKFIFTAISRSARAREYEVAIQWLLDAGLIIKSFNSKTPKLPLEVYADKSIFKIFMLDVGLLGAMSHLDPVLMLQKHALFTEFKGALTENFVAQELHLRFSNQLYYWTSEGIAEIDFLLATKQKLFPLEVKAGISKKKKSLLVYKEKYQKEKENKTCLSRATLRNFISDGEIVNYPLYAVALFPF